MTGLGLGAVNAFIYSSCTAEYPLLPYTGSSVARLMNEALSFRSPEPCKGDKMCLPVSNKTAVSDMDVGWMLTGSGPNHLELDPD